MQRAEQPFALATAVVGAQDTRWRSHITVVVGTVMIVATLRLGQALVLPVVIATLLTLTLSAPVRWLQTKHVPGRLAAALVVLAAVSGTVGGVALLAPPAVEWVSSAPATMKTLETRIRVLMMPLAALQRSADRMQESDAPPGPDAPRKVQIVMPGLFARLMTGSLAAIPTALSVVFLTYFLLSNQALMRRKLARLLPGRRELERREHLLAEIELAASRFLITVTVVNLGVGTITGLAMWAVGVRSPMLFGALAAVLNFIPYLGPLVTMVIVTLAALASVEPTGVALIAPAVSLALHLTESNVITPMMLGRALPLNTVAMFLGLLFFGWLWGLPGAVLAVPLTVCAKLVCDHVSTLAHVGELLGT